MTTMELTDDQVDAVLVAMSREGFELPFMARSSDYATPAELKRADEEAWQENRTALRTALREGGLLL